MGDNNGKNQHETADKNRDRDRDKEYLVTVRNEDDGHKYPLHVGRGVTIDKVIKEMYKEFKVERQPGDRLRCEASGEDVFALAEMHLRDYLATGHCPDLIWVFVGDTGGA